MIIKLEKYEVQVKDALTWGDKEEINAIVTNSAKIGNNDSYAVDGFILMQSRFALVRKMVVSIKDGEHSVPYSEDWLKNLSVADGDKLYSEIEKVSKKK